MESSVLFSGVFDLPWWGLILAAIGLTHITIVSVTVFLHRCQAHRVGVIHCCREPPRAAPLPGFRSAVPMPPMKQPRHGPWARASRGHRKEI